MNEWISVIAVVFWYIINVCIQLCFLYMWLICWWNVSFTMYLYSYRHVFVLVTQCTDRLERDRLIMFLNKLILHKVRVLCISVISSYFIINYHYKIIIKIILFYYYCIICVILSLSSEWSKWWRCCFPSMCVCPCVCVQWTSQSDLWTTLLKCLIPQTSDLVCMFPGTGHDPVKTFWKGGCCQGPMTP